MPTIITSFIIISAFVAVDAFVCKMVPRWDSSVERMRWAMPTTQLCLCQGVIAPKGGPMMCPLTREEYGEDSSMWYVDDARPLTDRRNWMPTKMNELLRREVVCSKFYKAGKYVMQT